MIVDIRSAQPGDFEQWLPLWQAYLTFYKASLAPEVTQSTWSRIVDPLSPLTCRVATQDGRLVGFAHHNTHVTTWDIRPTCYLEDLFVSPDLRGGGVGRALIDDLVALGKAANWATIYWITADDNTTAQKLYNTYNQRDPFMRYSITL